MYRSESFLILFPIGVLDAGRADESRIRGSGQNLDKAAGRLYEEFTGIEAPANLIIDKMGLALNALLQNNRNEILMVMQSFSIAEPEIRVFVREKFEMLHHAIAMVLNKSGILAAEAAASQFVGMGLMITVSEVLELPQLRGFKEGSRGG